MFKIYTIVGKRNRGRLMGKFLKFLLILIIIGAIAFVTFFGIQRYVDNFASGKIITPERAPVCDAVMVLGAMVHGETPSPILADRLDYAFELYKNGKAKKILVSGDHGREEYDEVNAMKQYLLDKDVPEEDIFMDHAGFNTYDSMYRAKEVFQVETMIISTQEFHINRALYLAEKIGIEAYGYPSKDKALYNMKVLNVREGLAKIKAFIDADILKRDPKFGGEAIPISGSGLLTEG